MYDKLPVDGTAVSNPTLQRQLRWDDDRYFTVRNALLDAGLVTKGRGRGGVVRRVSLDTAEERTVSVMVEAGEDATARVEATLKNELSLYAPLQKVLRNDWAKDHRREPLSVEVTAM